MKKTILILCLFLSHVAAANDLLDIDYVQLEQEQQNTHISKMVSDCRLKEKLCLRLCARWNPKYVTCTDECAEMRKECESSEYEEYYEENKSDDESSDDWPVD